MLLRFLMTIHTGEVQSLLEIARTMDISPDMVLQMARELTNRGYLQEIGPGCQGDNDGCPDCAVNSNCQTITRHWFLSEKGRALITNAAISK